MKKILFPTLAYMISFSAQNIANASVAKSIEVPQTVGLENKFKQTLDKKQLMALKEEVINMKGKSVQTLIKVMKDNSFPEKNRWMATFLLGQVMGKQSAPFISKFATHPDWIMRMASLKTLAALKQTQTEYKDVYKQLLKDDSMLVRYQALDTVKELGLNDLAPNVWAMLYDKKNYHTMKNKTTSKRTHIVRKIITTIGELKFEKAKKPLLSMMQKDKYKDIHEEIDKTLQSLYGKKSPENNLKLKKDFWKKVTIAETTI